MKKTLEKHSLWIETNGKAGVRANLSKADLRWAYLSKANLTRANLSGANLSGADLRGANLRKANLSGANLSGADLRGANLRKANLRGTHLRGANLIEANLSEANLSGANLSEAKGIFYIGADSRGWVLIAWKLKEAIWFNAGCHSFDKNEALSHWGSASYPDKERGNKYVQAINFLSELWEKDDK